MNESYSTLLLGQEYDNQYSFCPIAQALCIPGYWQTPPTPASSPVPSWLCLFRAQNIPCARLSRPVQEAGDISWTEAGSEFLLFRTKALRPYLQQKSANVISRCGVQAIWCWFKHYTTTNDNVSGKPNHSTWYFKTIVVCLSSSTG